MRTFWTTADLRDRGRTARQIRRAVGERRVAPVRTGWYATPDAPDELVRAVRVGGLATAHTAARSLGLWTPPDEQDSAFRRTRDEVPPRVLRVAVAKNRARGTLHDPEDPALRLGSRADVQLYWERTAELLDPSGSGRVGVALMLEHLFRTESSERALAVVDSALHLRHLRVADLAALAGRLPAHLRPVVMAADGRAESGVETIVRCLLRHAGLRVDVQPSIDGVGRVDLLVEGRLIIECDGREWHDDDEAFENDRRRDVVAAGQRYRVLRLSWFRVLFRWPEVEAAVFASLAA